MMKVGIAAVDLTPDGSVVFDGWPRENPSAGVDNPISGTCVVFDDGQTRVGLMALDLLAVDDYLMVPIRRAAKDAGIHPRRMMVNTSHSHSSPNTTPCRSLVVGYTEDYLVECREKLCGLVAEAVANLQEARLDYTVGSCTMGLNRRRQGSTALLPSPDVPIDPSVPVLRVLSPHGDVRGVLFSYGCHPSTYMSANVGTDYPGFAREYVAEKVPGCVPVFLQGCGGDVKPRALDVEKSTFELADLDEVRELGRELGRAVAAALCGTPEPLEDAVAGDSEYVMFAFAEQPVPEDVAEVKADGGFYERWADDVQRVWDQGHKLPYQWPLEVQVLDLGGLRVVGMAAEVCAEVGLNLKSALGDRPVMPLGYTNGGWDYFAPESAYVEAGYGEGYEAKRSFMDTIWPCAQPRGWAPEAERIMIESVREIVAGL